MARRSSKLLRFENSLYKYNSESQTWTIENVDLNQTSKQIDISEKVRMLHVNVCHKK